MEIAGIGIVALMVIVFIVKNTRKNNNIVSSKEEKVREETTTYEDELIANKVYSDLITRLEIEKKFFIESDSLPNPAFEYQVSLDIFNEFQHKDFLIGEVGYPTAVISQRIFQKMIQKHNLLLESEIASIDKTPAYNSIINQVNEVYFNDDNSTVIEKGPEEVKASLYSIAFRHNKRYLLESIREANGLLDIYNHLYHLSGHGPLPQYFVYNNSEYNKILDEIRNYKGDKPTKAFISRILYKTLKSSGHDNIFLEDRFVPEKVFSKEAELILSGNPILWRDILRNRIRKQVEAVDILITDVSDQIKEHIYNNTFMSSDIMGLEKKLKEKVFKF